MAALNRASFDNVTYAPTGCFQIYQAWRTNISGVVKAPFPVVLGCSEDVSYALVCYARHADRWGRGGGRQEGK